MSTNLLNTKPTPNNLYGVTSLEHATHVYICLTIEDANAFIQAGAEAIALEDLENAPVFLEAAKAHKKPYYIIALDREEEDGSNPGKAAQAQLCAALKAAGLIAEFCEPGIFCGEKTAKAACKEHFAAFSNNIAAKAADIEKRQAAADLYQRTGAGMLETFMKEVQTQHYEPIKTGITNIDEALQGGFMSKTLVTLGAAPGMGKTAIAQYILENMAENGRDVLYINLEMDRSQLIARSLARTAYRYQANENHKTDVTALDIMRGYSWNAAQRQTIEYAAKMYGEHIAPHFIYNPEGVNNNMSTILKACEDEVNRITASGEQPPIICIDYLQLITYDIPKANGKAPEDTEGIKQAIADLKNFAKDHNTIVLLIIAHNRAANKEGRVTMESGRDTSVIEYTGDLMLGLNYTAIEDHETYISGTDRNGNSKSAAVDIDYIQYKIDEADRNGEPRPDIANRLCLKILKSRFTESGRKARFIFDGRHSTFIQVDTKRKEP